MPPEQRAVAVFSKPHPEAPSVLRRVFSSLDRLGCEPLPDEDTAQTLGLDASLAREEAARRADLAVVIGGDGTLLASARAIGARETPILGINLGHLGFLTELRCDEIDDVLAAALAGRAPLERRPLLAVSHNDDQPDDQHLALNDVVISSSSAVRLFTLSLYIDAEWVTDYRADGLILSTPTGSTAYSLSAGGPVVVPSVDALLVTPICPHSLSQRPLVLPGTTRIRVVLPEGRPRTTVQATMDGQVAFPLLPGESVTVERAPFSSVLVRRPGRSFFGVLRSKLGWGHP
jgi:NAD+ kinase